jgi:hypothetical protein
MGLMPPLVKALAKLVEFFAAHPALGAAAVVGGVAAKGAIVPIASAAAPTVAKAAWNFLKGGATKVAAGATAGAAGSGGVLAGLAAPTSVGGVAVAGGAAAVAATAAAGAAAVGGIAAAVYAAKQLMNASKSEGGVWNAVSTAVSRGGELGGKALTPAEYDAKMARQTKTIEKSADVHEVLTRNLIKASAALERLSGSATGAARGNTGDGTSKGPGGITPAGPGWADKY